MTIHFDNKRPELCKLFKERVIGSTRCATCFCCRSNTHNSVDCAGCDYSKEMMQPWIDAVKQEENNKGE